MVFRIYYVSNFQVLMLIHEWYQRHYRTLTHNLLVFSKLSPAEIPTSSDTANCKSHKLQYTTEIRCWLAIICNIHFAYTKWISITKCFTYGEIWSLLEPFFLTICFVVIICTSWLYSLLPNRTITLDIAYILIFNMYDNKTNLSLPMCSS